MSKIDTKDITVPTQDVSSEKLIAAATHGTRLAWVDLAKASAIVLVVLHHVAVQAAPLLLPGSESAIVAGWASFSNALLPIRMPLFFLASGILAANAIERSWRSLWRNRVANLLWPFLIWSALFSVICAPRYRPNDPYSYMLDSLKTIPFGGNAYWFLSLLTLFFITARLFRRFLPAVLVLTIAAFGVASLSSSFLIDNLDVPYALAVNISRACYFAIWYFLGIVARDLLVLVEQFVRVDVMLASLTLYGIIAYAVYVAGAAHSIRSGLYQIMAVIGIVGVVQLAVYASRSQRLARLAIYLARRTLPIYLLHPILLSLLIIAVRRVPGDGLLPLNSALLDILLFPTVTVALIAASVALYNFALRAGTGWLFAFPRTSTRKAAELRPAASAGSGSDDAMTLLPRN